MLAVQLVNQTVAAHSVRFNLCSVSHFIDCILFTASLVLDEYLVCVASPNFF